MTDYPNNIPAKLEIIKASEITPKEVRWLWYPLRQGHTAARRPRRRQE